MNLVSYALVMPVAYLLSAVNGEQWRFRVVFVSLVLACPVVLSYSNLASAALSNDSEPRVARDRRSLVLASGPAAREPKLRTRGLSGSLGLLLLK